MVKSSALSHMLLKIFFTTLDTDGEIKFLDDMKIRRKDFMISPRFSSMEFSLKIQTLGLPGLWLGI